MIGDPSDAVVDLVAAGADASPPRRLAALQPSLAARPWLRSLLAAVGLSCVAADDLGAVGARVGDLQLDFAVIDPEAVGGARAVVEIRAAIAAVRASAPSAGVLVAYEVPALLDERLLGPRTWVVTPRTAPEALGLMRLEVQRARSDRNPLARTWPPPTPSQSGAPEWSGQPDRGIAPNFNVKHPAFLAVIGRLSVVSERTITVEISPQEALAFWPNEGSGSPRVRVKDALRRVRRDVDAVMAASGADLRLHLDHCDDPELMTYAMEAGFDSIMADGSHRSLRANARLLEQTLARAARYGVPVEGEVGAIDVSGRRKRDVTDVADLVAVLDVVVPHHVGVAIGQHHSCDYGFNRALAAGCDLAERRALHGGDDVISAFAACTDVLDVLAAEGYLRTDPERTTVHALRERLAAGEVMSIARGLESARGAAPPSVEPWLIEVERRWLARRQDVSAGNARLYETMIGHGVREEPGGPSAFVDLALLGRLSAVAQERGTRLVIHGGSSIRWADLGELAAFGVARVNFGTRPFLRFLRVIASHAEDPGPGATRVPTAPAGVQRFLRERATGWADWMRSFPPRLDPLVADLRRDYVDPLTPTADHDRQQPHGHD